jgi:gamma-glutamyltranspeptidase/glutathione hydrolase
MTSATPGPVLVPARVARGARSAVVAPHHLAAEAGLGVLRAGGTAVDAAIATNAAIATVMPSSCGIGGDAFWLIWDAAARRLFALNGSGRSAAAADAAALRARGLREIPARGGLAITVPGAVRSWGDAHARFGRLSRAEVLAPAIALAADGYPAWDGLIDAIERMSSICEAELSPDAAAGWRTLFRGEDRPWRPGERIRLPGLAATLGRLADAGFDEFYDGETGERQARTLAAAGSALTVADLRAHASTWVDPISVDYRGVRVASHPPNSSGVVALELLAILGRFRAPSLQDARWIHLGIEAAKLAMADRDAHLTDPDFADVPVERLLSAAHVGAHAGRIDESRAAPAPAATGPRGGGTIFLATADAEGNCVSLIESNWMGFGSGVADPALGIHYQNRGNYFSLDPGHPNVLEPRKRTLHTLLPWMLFRAASLAEAETPWVLGGSMGGDAQPQIAAQVISAIVDGGADVATAVAAPRWFVEPKANFAPPVEVRAERRFDADVLDRLEALGHPVTRTIPFNGNLGHAHAIEIVDGGPTAGGSYAAATDPRSAGLPAVW